MFKEKPGYEPEKNEGISRRDFLKSLGTAGAAAELASESLEASSIPDIQVERELFESKYSKIEFPSEKKEITPQILELAKQVVAFTNNIVDMSRVGTDASNKVSYLENPLVTIEALEKGKRQLWGAIKKYSPNVPEYSHEAYYKYIAGELPRTLAEYGVFMKTVDYLQTDFSKNRVVFYETMPVLSEVKEKVTDETTMWGQKIQRDILYVSPFTLAGDQRAFGTITSTSTGQAYYWNILINRENALSKDSDPPELEQVLSATKEWSNEQFFGALRKRNDNQMAMALTMVRLIQVQREVGQNTEDDIRNTIVHETGHIIDAQDPVWKEKFKPKEAQNLKERLANNINFSVHEEISGILSELRYGEKRHMGMKHLLTSQDPRIMEGDFMHMAASNWIYSEMVNIILKDPTRYNINLEVQNISRESAILLQMPNLLKQPNLLNELAEQVHALHKQNYDHDFSPDYFRVSKINISEGMSLETWEKVAIGTVTVAAGIWALKKFNERKDRVQAEELSKRKNSKKTKK